MFHGMKNNNSHNSEWTKIIFKKVIFSIKIYSTSICPFESGKFGKEGEKLQKIGISRKRKELFRWNKKRFSCLKEYLGEKKDKK